MQVEITIQNADARVHSLRVPETHLPPTRYFLGFLIDGKEGDRPFVHHIRLHLYEG